MASWEDLYDDTPSNDSETTVATQPDAIDAHIERARPKASPSPTTAKEAPPKPVSPSGSGDAGAISHAYNAGQPKVRILQRAAPATQQNRNANTSSGNAQNDESVARFHANFEQKQRDYEAARKKLFHDSELQDANAD